jgi:hypothetical protein
MRKSQGRATNTAPQPARPVLLTRFEMAVALLATLWVLALHGVYLFSAGPLWRDEAGTIGFASLPSLAEIGRNLQYDNFPPLFVALARVWTLAGGTADFSYRVLGALLGVGTLAVFWFGARKFGARAPLLALVLFAANPLALRVGDSMRPYGLGIALTLLASVTMWDFARRKGTRPWLCAVAAAVLSVQCLYQNAFLLAAYCCGAWAVTLARREWKTAARIAAIGAAAAVSLLADAVNIKKAQAWFGISRQEIHWSRIAKVLSEALNNAGGWMTPVWAALLVAALAAAIVLAARRPGRGMAYHGIALAAGLALYLLFLRHLGLEPRAWYFLLPLAPAALAMDAIFGEIDFAPVRLARAGAALLIGLACLPACYGGARLRQSNVDLVAAQLRQAAQPGDLILVSPWYYGVSLQRYFDARRFVTLPPMSELRIHRYDLMKRQMEAENPIGPLLEAIPKTLQSGHALWVVGVFETPPPGPPQPVYPPYHGGMDMPDARYFSSWMFEISGMIQAHALSGGLVSIPVPGGQTVNPVEDLPLLVIRGWRE